MTTNQRQAIVAVDLGAESCRVSLLRFQGYQQVFQIVHRCANGPIQTERGLVWDFEYILTEILEGLHKCVDLAPEGIASIGVDGWAVDNVRLDASGHAIGSPFCYRDERTVGPREKLHARISPVELYELTGAQDIRINTVNELYADSLDGVPADRRWLTLPEYLLYRIGGERVCEYTNATHTRMLNIHNKQWSKEIFAAAGLPLDGAPKVVQPGADVGKLADPLAKLPAFQCTRLIAPACHDTASAIAGIPATGDDWAFVSSGTWSLVGTVVNNSISGEEARNENFTNRGGIGGTIYLLKNVNGMWMLKQCLDHWRTKGVTWDIGQLIDACRLVEPPNRLLDVDHPDLMLPGDMPSRTNAQLIRNGTSLPEDPSYGPRYASLIFHSLAARYAAVLKNLSKLTSKKFKRIFIVDGGSRNAYLNSLVEAATGAKVIPASTESSTVGNFAIQLAASEGWTAGTGVSAESVAQWASILNTSIANQLETTE
jgi:rhamnulokinase